VFLNPGVPRIQSKKLQNPLNYDCPVHLYNRLVSKNESGWKQRHDGSVPVRCCIVKSAAAASVFNDSAKPSTDLSNHDAIGKIPAKVLYRHGNNREVLLPTIIAARRGLLTKACWILPFTASILLDTYG
jgi:hypothetical protein